MKIQPVLVIGFLIISIIILLAYFKPGLNTSAKSLNSTDSQTVVTQELPNQLVNGFPSFPVFTGAKLIKSYNGKQADVPIFGATWEVSQIDGQPVDNTGTRLVMHWYEDEAFPEAWIFDQPLKQYGDVDNPSKDELTVNNGKIRAKLTVSQANPNLPVEIIVLIKPL